MSQKLHTLAKEMRDCRLCAEYLNHDPRPVFQLGYHAPVLIAGQAPGKKVHASGIPFDDPSGDRLRSWLGAEKTAKRVLQIIGISYTAVAILGFLTEGQLLLGIIQINEADKWLHVGLAILILITGFGLAEPQKQVT